VKKSKKIPLLATIVLSLSIAVPTIMYAAQQQRLWHRPCVTHWDMFKLMRDLDLTDQQEADLKAIGMQTVNEIEPIMQQRRDLRKQMRTTLLSAEIDTVQAESQIDEMIELNSQIADKLLHVKIQEAQVLTPEQRATLLAFTNQLEQCIEDADQIPSLFPDLVK